MNSLLRSEPTLLEFQGVSVELGGRPVLHNLSFSVRPGEILALVGPNGSGKTTLLRTALGLQRSASGAVHIHGERVDQMPPRERARRMAWLPQSEAPADNLTVRDYVALGRYPHLGSLGTEYPEDAAVVDRALKDSGLEPFAARGVLTLSGGERQRVLFARALAQEAPLLLLDEPTTHLDVSYQFQMMEHLTTFARGSRERAVLLSLHDLNLACRYADRILWLAAGRSVALGTPQETTTEERIYRVFGIDAGVHTSAGQVVVFPRRPPALTPAPMRGGQRVHVICGGGSGGSLLQGLVDRGHEVTAGALNLLDSDQVLCERLHIPGPLESPFSILSEPTRATHRDYLSRAEVIVIAPLVVGPGNIANLDDVRPYVSNRPTFLVGGPPGPNRDYTGGRAVSEYRSLQEAGAREVADAQALFEEIGRLGPGQARPRSDVREGATA